MRSTHRTRAGALRLGLAVLLAASGGACHAPDAPASPEAAERAAATPKRRAAPQRTRALALKALAAYGNSGSRYEMRSVAFVATAPPAEVTETLYFTYLERRPDGSARTGRGVARCRDGGRQLVTFWRREDPPT